MDKMLLESYVSNGFSIRRIAKIVEKSPTTVKYWLYKHGLKTHPLHKCKCGETNPNKFAAGRYAACKKCRNGLQTDRFREYKKQAVEYKGGKCQKCGYDKCVAALDFHHINPEEKDPNWRKMRNWTFERIKPELDKCILVCGNCHAEIHYQGVG